MEAISRIVLNQKKIANFNNGIMHAPYAYALKLDMSKNCVATNGVAL